MWNDRAEMGYTDLLRGAEEKVTRLQDRVVGHDNLSSIKEVVRCRHQLTKEEQRWRRDEFTVTAMCL